MSEMMFLREPYDIVEGTGPIVATALHDGHELRPEVARRMKLTDSQRRREEDPFTAAWTSVAASRVVAYRSRFEVDLNRPLEQAIYLRPEDAWGLDVWSSPLPDDVLERSRTIHTQFYSDMHALLTRLLKRNGRVVVLDIHSYNHCRQGRGIPADCSGHPDVNLGTGTLDRQLWGRVVDRFADELRAFDTHGGKLDVRENVIFRGGYWPRWVHETFSGTVCAIAIEFKKFFMDEWTGQPDEEMIVAIGQALERAAHSVVDELERWNVAAP
jgi:N-formylglutamate amidohydrolase